MQKRYLIYIELLLLILLIDGVLAHGDAEEDVGDYIRDLSINIIMIASGIIGILVIISIHYEKKLKKYKKLLFIFIVIPIVLVTIFLAISTIYLNLISETKGPVHWHADFEVWNCGEKLGIIDPEGFTNRIGSSVFHEHNDNRIHVEGVVTDFSDVDLSSFFSVIGGKLSDDELIVNTNKGEVAMKNGDVCNYGSGKLQVFVYKMTNPDSSRNSGFIYKQEKLENLEGYVLSPYENVPPGDCIVVEFDKEKESTDHICETYKLAINKGDLVGS